jgi:predicted tellurium resistance membrane protein TerC
MIIIISAVFIGILIMRFIAQKFSILMEKFPKLEATAFIVILLLGFKLILSGLADWLPSLKFLKDFMDSHTFDFAFSFFTMIIFFFPLLMPNKETKEYISFHN